MSDFFTLDCLSPGDCVHLSVCVSPWHVRVLCYLSVTREGSVLPGSRRAASSKVDTAVEDCSVVLLVPLRMISQQPPDERLVKLEE